MYFMTHVAMYINASLIKNSDSKLKHYCRTNSFLDLTLKKESFTFALAIALKSLKGPLRNLTNGRNICEFNHNLAKCFKIVSKKNHFQ